MSEESIVEEINSLLEENPLLFAAVDMGEFLLKKYNDADWEHYVKETGNEHCKNFLAPRNGIEKLIDESTGYDKARDINVLKFILWCIKGFKEGLESEEEFEL